MTTEDQRHRIAAVADAGEVVPNSVLSLLHIGLLLLSFMFQASVEEVIFRGWMLSAVARKTNVAVAVLLVSLVFCFLHFSPHQPPLVILSTFLFSLLACAWTLRTGSIWA